MEDMLDVQLPGCIPEYENMPVPKCHPLFDPNCQSERYIPFLRSRYDFRTGYSPGNPRQQLNEITPWFDGTLIYGPAKGWADALRAYSRGELAANNQNYSLADQVPAMNTIGLPYANAPPPANHTLLSVNRFWSKFHAILHQAEYVFFFNKIKLTLYKTRFIIYAILQGKQKSTLA